jgi:hypothetical protein
LKDVGKYLCPSFFGKNVNEIDRMIFTILIDDSLCKTGIDIDMCHPMGYIATVTQ